MVDGPTSGQTAATSVADTDLFYLSKGGLDRSVVASLVIGAFPNHTETGASYTAGTNDEVMILADATAASQTINLLSTGRNTYIIKKIDSSVNTVTIDPAGAATIDGSTTKVLTVQYTSLMIVRDGSGNWHIA